MRIARFSPELAAQLERGAQVRAAGVEIALRAGQAAHVVERQRLARAVLDGAEALQGLVERGRGPREIAGRARGPGQVVERIADGLGAGEAMEEEDRLLEVQARAALRARRAAGTGRTSPPSKNGVSSSGSASRSASASQTDRAGLLAVGAVPRRHGRGVRGGGQQPPVAEPAGQGDRVGEQRVGARGVADRLLEHRVLVEGRGGRVLVAQLAVVGDRRLDAVQVARRSRRCAATSPALASRASTRSGGALGRGDQRRVAASGRPRRSSRGPARSATARWPGAGRPAGRGAGRRSGRRAGCRARSPACAASGAGRRTAGRAPRPGPGTSRGGARRPCRARPTASRRSAAYWRMVSSRRKRWPGRADERLVDQSRQRGRRSGAGAMAPPAHTSSAASSVKPPAKTRQAAEEHALLAGEQVVAPLDRGAQRLLARARRAAAGGEDVEAVAQPRRDLLQRQRGHARRGQLDGQRHAVQAPADLLDRRLRPRSVGLKPGSAAARSANRRLASASDGTRQATSPSQCSGSRLVARTRTPGPARSRSSARRAHASITCSQLSSTTIASRAARCAARASCAERWAGIGTPTASAVAWATSAPSVEAGELDEPDAVGDRLDAGQRLDRQARLAAAAGADQREQADARRAGARSRRARARGRRTRSAAGAGCRACRSPARARAARGTGCGSRDRARRPARRRAAGAAAGTAPAPAGGGRWPRRRA